MNNNYFSRHVLGSLLFVFCIAVSAQDTLTVDSNNGAFGHLNTVIVGDTTLTGERASDVYRLLRGETYLLSGPIENRFPLTIVAEDGDGPRPRLVPGREGGSSSRPFRARDNLTLKGLYVTGMDNGGFLNTDQRIIRISATGAVIRIDDCHLDQDGQSCFRTDSDNISIYVNNSTISNIGRPNNTNNGRLIDDRGSNLDTVIVENSTIYNISSTLCNDRGGWIQYAKINQNTIAHTGQRIFDFVETQTAIFTNNLVINPGYLGFEIDTIPDNEVYLFEFDSLGGTALADLPDVDQTFTFSNNNIFYNEAVVNAWPQDTASYPFADWPIGQRILTTAAGEAFAGEAQLATNIIEVVSFENAPPVDDLALIIDQFYLDSNSEDFKESVKPWDIEDEPYDFRYQDSFESAFASTDGGALGAPVWELILSGKSGLEQSLTEAQGLLTAAEVGGNIGQYAQEAVDALTAAIAAAQAILDDPSNTPETFQNGKATLDQAIANFNGALITGLDFEFSDQELLIYPNPATDYVTFSDPNSTAVEIWTISGRLVGKSNIRENARLSVAPMRSGTYVFRITKNDGSISTVKFIKQ